MKKDQIIKNVGARVQLIPIAHRLDERGRSLDKSDDDWLIEAVDDRGVHISDNNGLTTALGFDHIHDFTSNPSRSKDGERFGFLTLTVQLTTQGRDVRMKPTQPGKTIPPDRPLYPSHSLRLALFRKLHDLPGVVVHPTDVPGFEPQDVTNEIVRAKAEGLIEAAILKGDGRVLAAEALKLLKPGAEWLRREG